MSSLGWYQLGKSYSKETNEEDIDTLYFNKIRFFSFNDREINTGGNYITIVSRNGGPIATIHKKTILSIPSVQLEDKYLRTFTQSGILISKSEWKEKVPLFEWGFDYLDNLVILLADGTIVVYNSQLYEIRRHSLLSHFEEIAIISAYIYTKGVVILLHTPKCRLYLIDDIHLEKPNIQEWSHLNYIYIFPEESNNQSITIPISVLEEEKYKGLNCNSERDVGRKEFERVHDENKFKIVLGIPHSKEILITNFENYNIIKLNAQPRLIAIQPKWNIISVYKDDGSIDFIGESGIESTFTTGFERIPSNVKWCGSHALALYWSPKALGKQKLSLLLIIGPERDYFKLLFDSNLQIETEIDGLRIISEEASEFLYKVPSSVCRVFKIGSMDPATILYEAYNDFENMDPSAVKNLRRLGSNLNDAVLTCIQAAGFETDKLHQNRLLQASALGKSFPNCKRFNHDQLRIMIQKIRILNHLRSSQIGISITLEQFENIFPLLFVEKLSRRNLFNIASEVCSLLKMSNLSVKYHWSLNAIQSMESDRKILKKIKKNLYGDKINFSLLSVWANQLERSSLSNRLLKLEDSALLQIEVLLELEKYEEALLIAVNNWNSELVFFVFTKLLQVKSTLQVIGIISNFEFARKVIELWALNHDRKFLKSLYDYNSLIIDLGISTIKSFKKIKFELETDDSNSVLDESIKNLNISQEILKSTKDNNSIIGLIDNQIELSKIHLQMNETIPGKDFTDLSLADTIFEAYYFGTKKSIEFAEILINKLEVDEKKSCWIKVRALAKSNRWEELNDFCLEYINKKKIPPIGFVPFAEECIREGNNEEAKKYISKIQDNFSKVSLYSYIEAYDDAIDIAYSAKSIEMLNFIYKTCLDTNIRNIVKEKIDALS